MLRKQVLFIIATAKKGGDIRYTWKVCKLIIIYLKGGGK